MWLRTSGGVNEELFKAQEALEEVLESKEEGKN